VSEPQTGIRNPSFDGPVLVTGVLLTGALSVGLATAFLFLSRTSTIPDVGPTAASLDAGISTLFGAALGLLVGSGISACVARRGSRIATGIIVGAVAYAAVLVPVLIGTAPNDVSVVESIGIALFFGLPLLLAVLTGTFVGAGIAVGFRTLLGQRYGSSLL